MNRGVPTSADNSSGPSVGASSLVTDANSGLSGGPHLQRSASINADSYMRLPASPLSFSSNNISGSSAIEAGSVLQESSRGGQLQGQVASCATSLLASQDARILLPPHKKPRFEMNADDILKQQAIQQLLHRSGLQQIQGGGISQVHHTLFQQQSLQQRHHPQVLQTLPAMQRVQIPQQEQMRQHQLQQQQQQQQQQLQQQQQQQQQLQQQQQQLYQQAMQQGPYIKRPMDGGILARRLMQYLYHQQQRPQDNNILYWRKFVAEYFSPRAKKKWCLSSYENIGNHVFGVFPRAATDVRHCGICGSKSGKGFETSFEVLPRLYKIKFESGIMDEILFLDMPLEYRLTSGIMILDYAKAVMESVYEHLRVVREGQLRIMFATDLKILSWEFCTRRHEELLPKRLVAPPVNQLIQAAHKYQNAVTESGSSGVPPQDLRANCNMFVTAGCQLARNLELQSLNDLGFSKRYVRCLQIAEVVDIMKDLISFSREQNIGPIESLKVYPGRAAAKVESQILPDNYAMNPQNLSNNQVAALTKLLGRQPSPNPQINRNPVSGVSQGTISLNNYQALLRQSYITPNISTVPRAIHSGTGLVSNNISFQGNPESFTQPILNNLLPQKRLLGQMAGNSPQNVILPPNLLNQFPQHVNQRMLQDLAKKNQGTSPQSINGPSTSGSTGGAGFGPGIDNVVEQPVWSGAPTNNTMSARTDPISNSTSVSSQPNNANGDRGNRMKLTPDNSADIGSSSSYLFQEVPGSPELHQLYQEISQEFMNSGMFESRQREIGDWKP